MPRPFGDYELLEEIARGGMGVVYRARQVSLKRQVALKVVLAGEFASPQARRRFRREVETAAGLQHPNIVAVHEAGECEGQPYFTMDFIEGQPLSEAVRENPLPARQAARYLEAVAEAVDFAHAQGVIHRDLKPSNVLIDQSDTPRIADFGLAHATEGEDTITRSGQLVGSPSYMAPEQVSVSAREIGPAADVYGLGALLYHVITGRPPFQGETLSAVLRLVEGADPIAPRQLNPGLPADLETICLKCLEKDPGRRYASAQEVADELGRFQRGEPIRARPLPAAGRLWRLCRRHPAVSALSATVLLLLLTVALGSVIAALRLQAARQAEQTEREKSEAANQELRRTVQVLELRQAEGFFTANDAASGVAHLAAILRRDPSDHIAASRLVSALLHRNWAVPIGAPLAHTGHVVQATFSPDGAHVLTASSDHTGKVWNADTGLSLFTVHHEGPVYSAHYSPDGLRIVTASADGTAGIWDARDGHPLTPTLRHAGQIHWSEFSPDSESVITAGADGLARIWKVADGSLQTELPHSTGVVLARFSPDGEHVATGTESGTLRLWRLGSKEMSWQRSAHHGPVKALAFSRDGSRLVSASMDGSVQLWHAVSGESIRGPLRSANKYVPVWHADFSPDSETLLTAAEDNVARLFVAETGFPTDVVLEHGAGVRFAAFSPDGELIVTTSADHTARLWGAPMGKPICQSLRAGAPIVNAGFSPDGRRLVIASTDHTAQLWNLEPTRPHARQLPHDGPVNSVSVSPDGRFLLTTSSDTTARLWDFADGRPRGAPLAHESAALCGEFSPDGQWLITGCTNGAAHLWQWTVATNQPTPTRVVRHDKAIWSTRFSPDADQFLTASADGTVRLWSTRDGHSVTPPLRHQGEVLMAGFSRDGAQVVTASADGSARVWDANSGEPITAPLIHRDQVKWAEFSPDGQRVVTASVDDTASVWDISTSRPVAILPHQRIVEMASFSPDGRRVATASLDRTVRIWDPDTGQALTLPLQHTRSVWRLQFSGDGRRLATANGLVCVWDTDLGLPLTESLETPDFIPSVCFDPTSQRVAASCHDGHAWIWDVPVAPVPVPPWFLSFVESLAGIRLSDRGNLEILPRTQFLEARERMRLSTETGFYDRLARRFLTRPEDRVPAFF